MHSFRKTSPHWSANRRNYQRLIGEWQDVAEEMPFPHWWEFTGVDTVGHDWPKSMYAEKSSNAHPITRWLSDTIESNRDELYTHLAVSEDMVPLYTAFSGQTNGDHAVAWVHEVNGTRVFATTLGHGEQTINSIDYQRLITAGFGYATSVVDEDGFILTGFEGNQLVDNYQKTTRCHPFDTLTANTVSDVIAVVQHAAKVERPLKVISVESSNSNNQFICPDHGGILLKLNNMNQVLELDREALTVTVQPGIKSHELSSFLHENGYAVTAMPDYTGVSIAGGIATGAHHSSLTSTAGMADMITSMKIVDGLGQLQTIENDDLDAAAVHFGMLGVVVELTLKIVPQFKLKYGFEKGTDDALEQNIEAMVREHDYARMMWFAGNGRFVFDYLDRVDISTPGESRHNLWSSTGSIFRWVGDIPYRVLNTAPLRAQCDGARVRSNLWIPPFDAVDSPRDEPVGWSHEMLGSICEPGRCPWDRPKVKSRTMEAAIPLRYLPAWMADVRALLAVQRACFPILGIYMRFLKGTDRWMALNNGDDTVAIEIHVPKIFDETRLERSSDVYSEILQMTVNKYGGRPHWGKNTAPYFEMLGPQQFPRWNEFLALQAEMDPAGLFQNRLWRTMTKQESSRQFPGCVLSGQCICEMDSDCGEGYRCDQGHIEDTARVCREN